MRPLQRFHTHTQNCDFILLYSSGFAFGGGNNFKLVYSVYCLLKVTLLTEVNSATGSQVKDDGSYFSGGDGS